MVCSNCGNEIANDVNFCPHCGGKVTQAKHRDPRDISAVWPEWSIEKELGKGSYGTVYQTVRRDNGVESHAAIKVISVPSNQSELDSLRAEGLDVEGSRTYLKGIVDDFVSEIRLMESLKGIQNIVSIEDYKVLEKDDTIGWDIYIRMELLTPLNEFVSNKPLTEKDVIKLGCDICTALEICGRRNIIHRDIKPENIFVNFMGDFKLGDFGVARKLENVTGGLSQKGAFNYMAPEVASSGHYDATIDLYSLGITLYRYMNRNRLPFYDLNKQLLTYNDRQKAVERRLHGEKIPAPCDASPALAQVILRACEFDPAKRFSNATEMKRALQQIENGITPQPMLEEEADLNKTVSVRKAGKAIPESDPNVPSVPLTNTPTPTPVKVDTFGAKNTKKSKAPWIIAIIAIALVISVLLGVVAVAVANLLLGGGGDDDEPSKSSGSSSQSVYIPNYSSSYLSGVASSSHLSEPKANIEHLANRAVDGKTDTGWVEGAGGYGENEFIQLQFSQECYVSGLRIYGGYHKSQDLYNKNSRPARIKITLSDGSHYYSDLNDVMQPQKITFSQPLATESITITIVSVYQGTEYKDTVISEVELF